MMHAFLTGNRAELIRRCKQKVIGRHPGDATGAPLDDAIPVFLDALENMLLAEKEGGDGARMRPLPGPAAAPPDPAPPREGAPEGDVDHARRLVELGYSIGQVVHDYGDVCEAITDLALERGASFGARQCRTLCRCMDDAIARAVSAFSAQRDAVAARSQAQASNERVGSLAHELRNALMTASLALASLEHGEPPVVGSSGDILRRSIQEMKRLVRTAIDDVREGAGQPVPGFPLAEFIGEAADAARLHAQARGAQFLALPPDAGVAVAGNRPLLLAALGNILQNAFKFTQPGTLVTLRCVAAADDVAIDVQDHCGGLPPGDPCQLFTPFGQHAPDRSGLGLGLTIALRSVEADGGRLHVRDLPGVGCIFTLRLPRLRCDPPA